MVLEGDGKNPNQVIEEKLEEKPKSNAGRPTKYDETMPEKVKLYMKQCELEGKLPKLAGLAYFVGVAKSTIQLWGEVHTEFSDSLEQMNARQEDILCEKGLKSEYNSTICKLMLSSNHGYSDRSDVTTGGEKIVPQIISFADAANPKEQVKESDNGDNPE